MSILFSILNKLTGYDPGAIQMSLSASEHRRAHDAAAGGRRASSIYAPSSGPNAVLFSDLPELIRRSRAAYRNNGWIKQGVKRHVSNEVGAHIQPLFQIDDAAIKSSLNKEWQLFVKHSDADGALNFYGQLALASMTRRIAGECFIRIRPRRIDRSKTTFQLQMLEPEMVPLMLFESLSNGNEVINGIEFNRRGQRIAYHVYKRHPYDWVSLHNTPDINDTVRIPARLMLHHFQPERPGQIRGRPDTVQSLVAAFDYQEYSDAERIRKKSKAAHTAFLERGEYPEEDDYLYDPLTGAALTDASADSTTIEPGAYNVLNPGEKIKFPDGDNTGSGYSDFQRWQLLSMAAGLAQPYQIFSGDLQGMNDRLWRAITNEYFRTIDMERDHFVIHQICEPVKDFFLDQLWLNNLVEMPGYEARRTEYQSVKWQAQGRKSINRLQDVNAKKIEKREGFNSTSALIAEDGRDPEAVARERAEDQRRDVELNVNPGGDDA